MTVKSPHFPIDNHKLLDSGGRVRRALVDDVDAIDRIIGESAEQLGKNFYTALQRSAAIEHVFGSDRTLIEDGTYLIIENDDELLGCGGWSRRATLFGGDRFADRNPRLLDPAHDAARIRAFFVSPRHARRGVASWLLAECESAARTEGFRALELMATLPGVPFYAAQGFVQTADINLELGPEVGPEKAGVLVPFVAMRKDLRSAAGGPAHALHPTVPSR